ncbi:TlpA disulfide reductase family protein [Chitinophaga sp.]|uniref:TlpA family protein disulfide reductase n=1 Tax=Chitinophaga sp. TaxID=1869181 RepID=UPI0031E1D146
MQKKLLLALLLCCAQAGMSQTLLTGKISGPTPAAVELNISRDVWYQPQNSMYAKVTADGTFTFSLPENGPVLVTLLYNEKRQPLLLSAGRPLHVTFDAADLPGTIRYSGKGAAENRMVHAFFPPRPSFSKEFSAKNEYGKWPGDSLVNILLPAVLKEADSLRQSVSKASLSDNIKKSLKTHVKYYYALNLEEFSMVLESYNRNPAGEAWRDTVMNMTGIPSVQELNSSPYAGYFLQATVKHNTRKIGRLYKQNKEQGRKMLEEATGLSFDSLMHLANTYNDEVVDLLLAAGSLPAPQYEHLLANRLVYYSNAKELGMARMIQGELEKRFAAGTAAADGRKRIAGLEALLDKGKQNSHIVFREDYRQVSSVEELLAPYRGKVVYLDIWGTWCGWCKVEMGHVPALKASMAGKDVVFLYLSYDKDDADMQWREYVQLHHITGQHVRMPQERISKIWEELLPGEKEQRYPTYFIFGRDGKVAVKKAKRPSDGEALYTQLAEQL